VANPQLFVFGILVGSVVLLEWMVSAWSERATADAEVNRRIRTRIIQPIEIPVFGAIGIVALVFCVSRVLLAVGESASWMIAIGFAALVLLLGWVFAASPKSTRTAIAVICILGFLGVIAGGVISAAQGSRDYEKHEQERPFVPPDRNQPIPTTVPEK